MSFSETIFLFALALIIFGPKKLPEIARQVGKYLNEFKRASNEFKAQIEHEISNLEVEKKAPTTPSILPPVPDAPEGTAARSVSPTLSDEVEQTEDSRMGANHAEMVGAGDSPLDGPAGGVSAEVGDATGPAESPATLAVSAEVPVPRKESEPVTEALAAPDAVTSSPSQESHA